MNAQNSTNRTRDTAPQFIQTISIAHSRSYYTINVRVFGSFITLQQLLASRSAESDMAK
jgi:hypothetical protein